VEYLIQYLIPIFSYSSCVVNVKTQTASVDRVPGVEDGIEVGQDNLGMDSVVEETGTKRENCPGTHY
jgi:hypothetical protein